MYTPGDMEVYRGVTVREKPVEEGDHEVALFQENCRALAGSLFRVLRKYDPWCVFVNFDGPLPLNPDSATVSGYIRATIQDVVEGNPMAPYISYTGFEVTVPDKDKSGESLQGFKLSKWWKSRNREWRWEFETHDKEGRKDIRPRLGQELPEEFGQIATNLHRKWNFKPTKR